MFNHKSFELFLLKRNIFPPFFLCCVQKNKKIPSLHYKGKKKGKKREAEKNLFFQQKKHKS